MTRRLHLFASALAAASIAWGVAPAAFAKEPAAALAPAANPEAVGFDSARLTRLDQALAKAVAAPAFKDFMVKTSGEPTLSTPEELARFQAEDAKKWGRVIQAAGIQPE